jgi:hypothetical protein
MGVSLNLSFAVKSIFRKSLPQTTEIARVYAGFSPVRPDGSLRFLQPLVVDTTPHNYILCFSFFS